MNLRDVAPGLHYWTAAHPAWNNAPAWPEHEKISFKHDAAWIAPRLAQIRERWTQWLTT